MQIELTPQVIVGVVGLGLTVQTAIVTVAIMIRGTAKDLGRESAAREEAERAIESRFVGVERESHRHDIGLHGLALRADTVERNVANLTTTTAQHAQMLAAITASSRSDERRRR